MNYPPMPYPVESLAYVTEDYTNFIATVNSFAEHGKYGVAWLKGS